MHVPICNYSSEDAYARPHNGVGEGPHVGFGLLVEQGAESIHARFNSLRRTFASVPNGVERLRNTMKEHLISITPQNVAALLPPAREES